MDFLKHFMRAMVKNYLNDKEGNIKDGVDFIFQKTPELKNIGNEKEYSDYLDSIFAKSKHKNIFYHGVMKELSPKDDKFKGYVIYFTDNKNYAETFGFPINRKIIYTVLDIQKPYKPKSELADVPEDIHNTGRFTNPKIIKQNNQGYDSVIGIDAGGQKEGITVAVFDPEQIHILGSKKDIDGFLKNRNKQ